MTPPTFVIDMVSARISDFVFNIIYFDPEIYFHEMKVNYFWGNLTDKQLKLKAGLHSSETVKVSP